MILSTSALREGMRDGSILIDPFDERHLDACSYELHLDGHIARLASQNVDPFSETTFETSHFGDSFTIMPGEFYLASTIEKAGSPVHAARIDAKPSLARLGLSVRASEGHGRDGFFGPWTLEIATVRPFVLHFGMPICRIAFSTILSGKTMSFLRRMPVPPRRTPAPEAGRLPAARRCV